MSTEEMTICVDRCGARKCPYHIIRLMNAEGKTIFYDSLRQTKDCPKRNRRRHHE